MSEKLYLDSNLFIYAALNHETFGVSARLILERVKNGDINAVSSILSLDEVQWSIQKAIGKEEAHKAVSLFIVFPNITWVDVTKSIFADALNFYKGGLLRSRDSLHLATMKFSNVSRIVSNDSDFDKIKNIKRIKIE